MKLYELADDYRALMAQIDEAEGELSEEQFALLADLGDAFDAKVENTAKMVREYEADADAAKAEAMRLTARAKAAQGRADWLKGYLQYALESSGQDKVKGKVFTVALQACPPSCDVQDVDAVPKEYAETVTEIKVDRKAIIDHYKATGETVPGCAIVANRRTVRIR
jgi:gamma-glutamylcyclotransferase (GGCT)/AIG2-like uncharacterized protein YtfP